MTKVAALLCFVAILSASVGCAGAGTPPQGHSFAARVASAAPASIGEPVAMTRSTPANRHGIKDAYDGDDGASRRLEEGDDLEVGRYGQPSSPAETLAARVLVKSYFTAAEHENGAAGCALLTPSLAQGVAGRSYNAPQRYLRGRSCAEVMTKLFVHRHKLMAAEAARVRVTAVRHTPGTVFVLLVFRGLREPRMMGLQQYGNKLRLEALQDSPYP